MARRFTSHSDTLRAQGSGDQIWKDWSRMRRGGPAPAAGSDLCAILVADTVSIGRTTVSTGAPGVAGTSNAGLYKLCFSDKQCARQVVGLTLGSARMSWQPNCSTAARTALSGARVSHPQADHAIAACANNISASAIRAIERWRERVIMCLFYAETSNSSGPVGDAASAAASHPLAAAEGAARAGTEHEKPRDLYWYRYTNWHRSQSLSDPWI